MRGAVLPLGDIDELLGSGVFRVPYAPFIDDQVLPAMIRGGFKPNDTKRLYLAGGGDPTYYQDGANGFVKLIGMLSKYAYNIQFLTGGLAPHISAEDLALAQEEMRENCRNPRLVCMVSHHPFGSPGHDERIKRAILCAYAAELKDTALKVRAFPQEVVDPMPQAVRAAYPFLTIRDFLKSPLYVWLMERFDDEEEIMMARDLAMLGGRLLRPTGKKLISIIYDTYLRETGRAQALPCGFCRLVAEHMLIPRNEIEQMRLKLLKEGISTGLRVTAEGLITGCESSRLARPEFYEGDLYGHSYDEIFHNRLLWIEHLVRALDEWLGEGKKVKQGNCCDDVCRTARERFAEDFRRVRSHRGKGKTVLRCRQPFSAYRAPKNRCANVMTERIAAR